MNKMAYESKVMKNRFKKKKKLFTYQLKGPQLQQNMFITTRKKESWNDQSHYNSWCEALQ